MSCRVLALELRFRIALQVSLAFSKANCLMRALSATVAASPRARSAASERREIKELKDSSGPWMIFERGAAGAPALGRDFQARRAARAVLANCDLESACCSWMV